MKADAKGETRMTHTEHQKTGAEAPAAYAPAHGHYHQNTKAVLNRMARLIGPLESTKKMIEEGRDCSDVLVQLAAVDSALKGVARLILKDHIEHCIVHAVEDHDEQAIARLNQAIDTFLK